MADLSRAEILTSLSRFKRRRDALLHEDTSELEHHLQRFVEICESDVFVKQVLEPILRSAQVDPNIWWTQAAEAEARDREPGNLWFPEKPDDELAFRFLVMRDFATGKRPLWSFATLIRVLKLPLAKERFLSLVVRPFAEELSDRLGEAANTASPEVRALQAVPPNRIPSDKEVKIFLSHRSTDKPIVERYYRALKELGFDPWLDEPNMAAGTNLEREILKGFEESCAAVFFITDSFVDEKYLATEIDYAIKQQRKKGKRFAIITLRFSENIEIPGLLAPYIYKTVVNDLDGFYQLVRALPVELGPIRWKEGVIEGA